MPTDTSKDDRATKDAELQAALAEAGDLSRAERLRILAAERDLNERTYWDVLGLSTDTSPAAIKKAYFEKSKRFHPDRYFGKKLGGFAARIDTVFRGIKDAYDLLSDPVQCKAYSAEHPPPGAKKTPPPGSARGRRPDASSSSAADKAAKDAAEAQARRERLEQRRAEIAAQRKGRHVNPVANQVLMAKSMFEQGKKLLAEGRLPAAVTKLGLAAAYAPNNQEYQTLYDEMRSEAAQQRSKELIDQAELEVATGQVGMAARLFGQAADLVPTMSRYALRAAELYAKAGEARLALDYGQRAVKASPRNKEARVLVASFLEERGDARGAVSHLEIALSLDKSDTNVKKTLKRLSKKVR